MIRSRDGVLRLGPADAGVELTDEEFERADFEPCHRYELVAGRLAVSPAPELPHEETRDWVADQLKAHARAHPDQLRRVYIVSRTITRALGATTNVEPDIAGYRHVPRGARRWQELSPVLVVEVVSDSDPSKDLVRNREIYWLVPSIQEYWIVDGRDEDAPPSMLALVRGPSGWVERQVPAGGTYRTELLPGLELSLIDTRD